MRAKDIFESEDANISWEARETLPPSLTIPDLDPYYEYYRFLISLAGAPRDIPKQSITRDVPMVIPYTKQEYDIVIDTINRYGKTAKHLTKKPSIEPDFVNKASPVRKFKDFK